MQHIVVNTRMLLKDRLDGTGWFAFQTLKDITTSHPEVAFTFLFDRPYNPEFIFGNNVTPVVLRPPVRHAVLYYLWYQVAVKRFLKKTKPDLFVSPDGFLAVGSPVKQLTVIHDLNFLHNPKNLKTSTAWFYNRYIPLAARAATRIATVSEFSKSDIVESYKVSPEKIDVVYNGVNESFKPLDEKAKQQIRSTYTQGKEYFLFVGSIHPRKNIVRLLNAFELFKESTRSDMKLVIAGSFFWGKQEIDTALADMRYAKDVIFAGRVADNLLPELVGAANTLSYIPLFEGFGIPVLEAMRSGVPVISSNVTSLPEVTGDAALLVDPTNVEQVSKAMVDIATDSSLRSTCIARGLEQSKKFSWKQTAEKLWLSIQNALQ